MSRLKILVSILILLLVAAVPYSLFDAKNRAIQAEFDRLSTEVTLQQARLARVRRVEAELIGLEWEETALATRLLGDEPFVQMEQILTAAAKSAKVSNICLELTGGEPHAALPGLASYGAKVRVTSSMESFVAFMHLLEGSPLLIEIPDLEVKIGEPAEIQLRFFREWSAAETARAAAAPARKSLERCK